MYVKLELASSMCIISSSSQFKCTCPPFNSCLFNDHLCKFLVDVSEVFLVSYNVKGLCIFKTMQQFPSIHPNYLIFTFFVSHIVMADMQYLKYLEVHAIIDNESVFVTFLR